jgi:hypothetical protein
MDDDTIAARAAAKAKKRAESAAHREERDKHRISIRLPPWLHKKLLEVCDEEKIKITTAVLRALRRTYVAERVTIHSAPPTPE